MKHHFKHTIHKLEEFLDKKRDVSVSFEFFPPKNDEMEKELWLSIQKLSVFKPSFVSVTYGALGTTRDRTHNIVKKIKEETDLSVAAHLTCIGSTKQEIKEIAIKYWNLGVRHIVALRGDIPPNFNTTTLTNNGYNHASELVRDLKKIANFEISVAGYPEKHPDAQSLDVDVEYLKKKIDAGADRVITQFFFDSSFFLNFLDKVRNKEIYKPIVPGILPISNLKQVKHFAESCQTYIPEWLDKLFQNLDGNEFEKTRQMMAAIIAIDQCRYLSEYGIQDFHFYTLNKSDLVSAICKVLL